ncbi:MAG: response regulator [Magnetococcales bacterium]|nr:response regulator [Magnetococcales bacterium]
MTNHTEKPIVLVVDDAPENLSILGSILVNDYQVKATMSGEKALRRIREDLKKPDMILLDVVMPEMDGYEVCRQLKADPTTAHIPVIFITANAEMTDELKGLELGAVDYITKPISPPIVKIRVRTHMALYNQQRELERMVRDRTRELTDTRIEIIRRLSSAAEFRDNETGLHIARMSHYTRLMAQSINVSEEWTELMFNAAPMHDIGKIGIPDRILLKPGKLDEEEWEVMRCHSEYGATIIGIHNSELMKMAREIALNHHEKWDGSGYPNGIKGCDIPLAGRIVAIADVFDALTSDRPYKKVWSTEAAVEVIDKDAGIHFDPSLVPILHKVLPDMLEVKQRYSVGTFADFRDPLH